MRTRCLSLLLCLCLIVPSVGVLAGAPEVPSSPSPSDGSSQVSIYADLSWTAGDPGPDDSFTYTVYLGTTSPPPLIEENQTQTIYDPGVLACATTYYWQIQAWNQSGVSSIGPVWQFSTIGNQPPFVPRFVKAPACAGPGISVNFTAFSADPEGGDVSFQWEWGDGRSTGWFGPIAYGEIATCSSAWIHLGKYSVRVRAQDTLGATSSWSLPLLMTIAPQIHIPTQEPGFLYFNFWGLGKPFGFLPILKQYGMSAVMSTDSFDVNATVSPAVHSVEFELENLLNGDIVKMVDLNMTNGAEASFTPNNGLYRVTASAFDADGNLIDRSVRDLTWFRLMTFNWLKALLKKKTTPVV
jgi:hypothetical protein